MKQLDRYKYCGHSGLVGQRKNDWQDAHYVLKLFGKRVSSARRHYREFVEKAFNHIGVGLIWEGSGVDEVGKNAETGKILVRIDPKYFRPTEVDFLQGDPSKAKNILGWEPAISFEQMVETMVKEDIMEAQKDNLCKQEGFRTYNHFE